MRNLWDVSLCSSARFCCCLLSTVPSSEPPDGSGCQTGRGGLSEIVEDMSICCLEKKKERKKSPRRHLVFLVLQQFSVWTAALWSRRIIHLPKSDGCSFHLWKTSFASSRISQRSLDHQKQTGINIQTSPLVTNIFRRSWNQQADEVVWGYPDVAGAGK